MDAYEGSAADRSLAGLARRVQSLAGAYASLVVVDARRAVRQVVEVMCVAIVATVLLVTAWLALVVSLAGWLVEGGTSWPLVLLYAALLNVVAAALAGGWLWRQVKNPPFAATLRQLEGSPPPSQDP